MKDKVGKSLHDLFGNLQVTIQQKPCLSDWLNKKKSRSLKFSVPITLIG